MNRLAASSLLVNSLHFFVDALRCGSDGVCYRGTAPCQSSQDDPLCNLPNANSAGDDQTSWRTCRQGSPKMQALETDRMYGGSALHMAALEGREGAMDWMLHHEQRDLNAQGRGGATPLHTAVVRPAGTSILQFLLAHGARVNAVDAFGFTPLHRAIQSGNFDGATLLLSSGANLTLAAPGVRFHPFTLRWIEVAVLNCCCCGR